MRIINEKPPVYDAIVENGMRPTETTIFAYGDAIYNPGGIEIPPYLIEHEETHCAQQSDKENMLKYIDPSERIDDEKLKQKMADAWWGRYLTDPYFRIEQEAEAYARQYDFMCGMIRDGNARTRLLFDLGRILASGIYGSVVKADHARQMIKSRAKVK